MKILNKVLLACLAASVIGVAQAAPQKPVVMVKVYGLYCKTCFGGAKAQMLRLPGVSRVDIFFKDAMIAVYPKGNVKNIPYGKIKGIVDKSAYKFKGMWVCKAPTLKLSTCKKV